MENSIDAGWISLSTDVFANSNPITRIIAATTRLARYSNLACPYGCSLSAGFSASLNPSNVTMELAASDRLFNPSAVIDVDAANFPITSLLPANSRLHNTPMKPVILPTAALFLES